FFDLANKEILVSVIANEVGFNVIVKDNIAYLELGNIFAKFDVKDIDKIENLLKNKFEIEVPLTEIVDKLTNAEISDKPLEKLKDLGLVINLNGFDLSFFDSIVVDGNTTTIPVEGVGEIALTLTDKLLSNIGYTGNGLDVSANLVDFEEITLSVSEDTYIELISLLPTIGNAIDIVNCDAISGSMTLNIGLSEPIVVDYYVNKADLNDIYAEFATVIQGANTKVVYYGGKVYIEFATSIKLVADFETLPATIENLLAKADIAFDIKDDIDTSNIINAIFDVINPNKTAQLITSLTKLDNGLEIGAGGIVVTLTNGATQIDFATTDVSGVIIGGDVVNAIPVIDDSAYTPLDDVLDLVEAFLNMAKKKDFHIAGSFDVVGTLIGIDIEWNIPFDIRIKDNNGDIEMMMTMGEIPVVVGLNNDVPYKTGDTNGGSGRYVSIYIKEGAVYIYRTEYVNQLFGWDTRKYEKCTKITIDTFLANPMYYFQYALGFSDSIIEAMEDSFSKAFNRENPLDLNNVVNSLTVVDGENFELILNLAELANNDLLDTLTLDLGLGVDGEGESILERLGLEMFMPLASVFELTLSTDDTMIVDWGTEVDMSGLYNYVNGYQYAFDAEWEASNGSWSKASEITYTISFEENGGESVNDVTGAYGTEFSLPTLSPTQTDDGEKQISRIFMGWYTTSTFDEGTEFTGNTIPKGDKTLYAKWYEYVRYYRTISFVTNSNEVIEPVKALEGDNITLPALSIKEEATETSVTIYTFVGWFVDEALTNEFTTFVMPNENTTLYAKWEVADVEEAHLLQVYDNGNVIYTRYILAGNAIDLSGVAKVNDTTKFYLLANFTTAYEGDFTMPEENLTLYIRNQYTLTYKSGYGTVKDTSEKVWQGETLSLPAQSTYADDDGTTRKITYTLSGYLVNGSVGELPSVMPNSDLSIVAVWTVETKKYYTITFNTGWVKCDEWMDNNSNVTGKITQKSAPTAVAPLTLLEGTTFDPSVYNSTCKYEYKAVWIGKDYNFKVLTWNTEGVKNISNGVSNDKYTKLTSYTVTGNATLYPTWGT
ncbi:MAG: InlB B-repeat-containing protein, partial [Clostridia bacterium]|nr:InlB B-repeat-containing protein [Clostridia bacterium]